MVGRAEAGVLRWGQLVSSVGVMTTKTSTQVESWWRFVPIFFQCCDPSCVLEFLSIFWVRFSSFYVDLGGHLVSSQYISSLLQMARVHSHYLCRGLMAQAAIHATWIISPQSCLVKLVEGGHHLHWPLLDSIFPQSLVSFDFPCSGCLHVIFQ